MSEGAERNGVLALPVNGQDAELADAIDRVQFGPDGLIPAVLQEVETGRVLTLAYMNRESLERTLREGRTWLWSRSRQELWRKGATSGNTQSVRSVALDCDADAVLEFTTEIEGIGDDTMEYTAKLGIHQLFDATEAYLEEHAP